MTRRPDRKDVATVDELHASATKLVGLDDFGTDDDNYREALGVLLDAYQGEAGLTVLGSKMNRFFLRGALVARLLSQSDLAGCPIFRIGPFFLRDNKVTVNPRFVRCGAGRAKSTSSEWISSEWTGHRLRVASPSNRPVLLHRTLKVPHGGCGCRRGVTVR